MKIRLSDIHAKAPTRPPGYVDAVLSKGTIEGDALIIEPAAYAELLKVYNPSALRTAPRAGCCGNRGAVAINPKPVPNAKSTASRSTMTGLGDLVHKVALPIARALKLPCVGNNGELKPESPCAKRRKQFNQLVPFSTASKQ